MPVSGREPRGPRGATGAAAEAAVADHLQRAGWEVLGRNLRVGRDEVDILAREPAPSDVLVVLEVRARTGPRFGAAEESVDARKVSRLYRAAGALRAARHAGLGAADRDHVAWRVDLVTVTRDADGRWHVDRHLRGLHPP